MVTGAAGLLSGLDEKAVAADLLQRQHWLDTAPTVAAVEPSAPEDMIWLEFPEVAALMQDAEADEVDASVLHLVDPHRSAGGTGLIFTVVYVSTLDRDLRSGEIREPPRPAGATTPITTSRGCSSSAVGASCRCSRARRRTSASSTGASSPT